LSSGEEEEEDDGGRALPERWEPVSPSPRAAEAAREQAPGTGAGALVARQSMTEAARAVEVPACAAEVLAHGGGVWGHGGGNTGRARSACRALEEEEARLLHPEVRNRSSRHPVLERQGFDFPIYVFEG
jgi:hypothetical protein